MNQAQNLTEQVPKPERPATIPPVSGKEVLDEAIRQARNDIQAILYDAQTNKRPWTKTLENVKNESI